MARTRRADYTRSNRIRTLPLSDPEEAAWASQKLLNARDALSRRLLGSELLSVLAAQTGVAVPELVVPDEHQPHRRSGDRKSTRLNSSHMSISYAVFCLK